MNSLLLVIDVQNQFINNHTKFLPVKIEELIDENKFDNVAFTKFINTTENLFYKNLNWKGCLTEKSQQLVIKSKKCRIFEKSIYSALNDNLIKYINENNISKIYLCGIDTECCVLKTAFDLFESEFDVYVLKDYCACTHGKTRHENALKILRRNIGKNKVI